MNKKVVTQIIIVFITVLMLCIFFYYYLSKKNNLVSATKITEEKNILSEPNQNIIKNIEYFSENKNGDSYLIFSDYGKIDLENPDLTYMTNVTAIVTLQNSQKIKITSNYANFNHKSYETEFFEKVKILRDDEKITCEELKFSLENNFIILSNDVILNKPNFNLKADKIEIDLVTKNSKITMSGVEKKIIAVGKNK